MKNVASSVSGRVLVVTTAVGGEVKPGDELFKIESMKMEIPVEAEEAGRIIQVLVREGDEIQEGQTLAILG